MSKPIGVKENNIRLSTLALFNHMTEEDFIAIHNVRSTKKFMYGFKLRFATN